jgi:hypothetical protein
MSTPLYVIRDLQEMVADRLSSREAAILQRSGTRGRQISAGAFRRACEEDLPGEREVLAYLSDCVETMAEMKTIRVYDPVEHTVTSIESDTTRLGTLTVKVYAAVEARVGVEDEDEVGMTGLGVGAAETSAAVDTGVDTDADDTEEDVERYRQSLQNQADERAVRKGYHVVLQSTGQVPHEGYRLPTGLVDPYTLLKTLQRRVGCRKAHVKVGYQDEYGLSMIRRYVDAVLREYLLFGVAEEDVSEVCSESYGDWQRDRRACLPIVVEPGQDRAAVLEAYQRDATYLSLVARTWYGGDERASGTDLVYPYSARDLVDVTASSLGSLAMERLRKRVRYYLDVREDPTACRLPTMEEVAQYASQPVERLREDCNRIGVLARGDVTLYYVLSGGKARTITYSMPGESTTTTRVEATVDWSAVCGSLGRLVDPATLRRAARACGGMEPAYVAAVLRDYTDFLRLGTERPPDWSCLSHECYDPLAYPMEISEESALRSADVRRLEVVVYLWLHAGTRADRVALLDPARLVGRKEIRRALKAISEWYFAF